MSPAEPHVHDTKAAELGSGRIRREVGEIRHRRLGPPQPHPYITLNRVASRNAASHPLRRDRAACPTMSSAASNKPCSSALDKPPLRPPFVIGDMHRGVALMPDLRRPGGDSCLALGAEGGISARMRA